ncbi:ribosomal protein S18-alanine N-acetyltransferase [bacterium]|nr:ribosomal protein S18-alanine N-acetyltransferase [bacterium]
MKKEKQNLLANNLIIENFSEPHLNEVFSIENNSNPTPWKIDTFKQVLEVRTISFVIKDENKIVAFCIASKVLDECHLQNISVIEGFRNQGLGTYVIEVLIGRAKIFGLKEIFLEVRESNKVAISFYKKLNFKKVGHREGYYKKDSGRESALLMSLALS